MAWWLLPAIGAGIGALTNLNKPDQTFKNALWGLGLGFGASAIPGLTGGVGSLLGIGGNSTVPLTTTSGVPLRLSSAADKIMSLTGNPAADMAKLSQPSIFDKALGFLKSPNYLMGASSLFNQMSANNPQMPHQANMVLGGGIQPQGQPRAQQPIDSGIYGTDFVSPFKRFKLGTQNTINAIDRHYPLAWRRGY